MTHAPGPRIVPFGDQALLAVFGDSIDLATNRRVHALAAAVDAARAVPDAAWGAPVPGYASLLVPYDPRRWTAGAAADRLAQVIASEAVDQPVVGADEGGRVVEIQVRYGGDAGPDLDWVAEQAGISSREVVELHASVEYRVFLLGFVPGFAYLGVLPEVLAVSRRASPRPRVPAGSVGIAARQTAVYPSETPGGWQLIGRTDARLWDIARTPPALLAAGDTVRFVSARD